MAARLSLRRLVPGPPRWRTWRAEGLLRACHRSAPTANTSPRPGPQDGGELGPLRGPPPSMRPHQSGRLTPPSPSGMDVFGPRLPHPPDVAREMQCFSQQHPAPLHAPRRRHRHRLGPARRGAIGPARAWRTPDSPSLRGAPARPRGGAILFDQRSSPGTSFRCPWRIAPVSADEYIVAAPHRPESAAPQIDVVAWLMAVADQLDDLVLPLCPVEVSDGLVADESRCQRRRGRRGLRVRDRAHSPRMPRRPKRPLSGDRVRQSVVAITPPLPSPPIGKYERSPGSPSNSRSGGTCAPIWSRRSERSPLPRRRQRHLPNPPAEGRDVALRRDGRGAARRVATDDRAPPPLAPREDVRPALAQRAPRWRVVPVARAASRPHPERGASLPSHRPPRICPCREWP